MRVQHVLFGLIVALGLGVAANVAAAQPAQGKPKVVRDLLWVWATPGGPRGLPPWPRSSPPAPQRGGGACPTC